MKADLVENVTYAFHFVKRLKSQVGTPFSGGKNLPVATLLEFGYGEENLFHGEFHFRLKSDKKPNGTKILAVQHVKYINRKEKFPSQEQGRRKINSAAISLSPPK